MFYAEAILSRRGPLAKVWLAAHWERKLSKTQTLQTDITQSVDAIMGQEVVPMALRLSGQLLLGVCRIYSRKAKYLLDDANEALMKIKMAFRPGLVDMTEDQLTVSRNAITLQGDGFDMDLMFADANWDIGFDRPVGQGQQHIARQADITLADNMQFDLDDPNFEFDLGLADGIGSQDFDFDIGVDFGDSGADKEKNKSKSKANGAQQDDDEDGMSVEVGRDANFSPRNARHSVDSALRPAAGDFDDFETRSRGGLEDFSAAQDEFGGDLPMDFEIGIDFGDNPPVDERPKTPDAIRDGSRASTPLSAPPATPPAQQEGGDQELTPKATTADPAAPLKKKRATFKKVIIDQATELEDGPGARLGGQGGFTSSARDVSEITVQNEFLPRSRTVMALMHIRSDPLAHFMPTVTNARGTFFCAAPPGMAPELTNLFMFPTHAPATKTRRERAASTDGEGRSPKRARLAADDDDDVEVGRRQASVARSLGVASDIFGRNGPAEGDGFGADLGLGMEDLQMDLDGQGDMNIDVESAVNDAKRRASKAKAAGSEVGGDDAMQSEAVNGIEEDRRSRYSTPADGAFGPEEGAMYSDVVCPIASFDTRPSKDSQTQQSSAAVDDEAEDAANDKDGYSKQTVKALGVLRKHFRVAGGGPVDSDATPRRAQRQAAEQPLSFNKLSEKASRRAAASFFFELLVLGTRDCVKLTQKDKFDNINIHAKDNLWAATADADAASRHSSLAP